MNHPIGHHVPHERRSLSSERSRPTHFQATWREGAALSGGILVLLITAWLIWAALAEAVYAMAETA